jgi:hypothetical protein
MYSKSRSASGGGCEADGGGGGDLGARAHASTWGSWPVRRLLSSFAHSFNRYAGNPSCLKNERCGGRRRLRSRRGRSGRSGSLVGCSTWGSSPMRRLPSSRAHPLNRYAGNPSCLKSEERASAPCRLGVWAEPHAPVALEEVAAASVARHGFAPMVRRVARSVGLLPLMSRGQAPPSAPLPASTAASGSAWAATRHARWPGRVDKMLAGKCLRADRRSCALPASR